VQLVRRLSLGVFLIALTSTVLLLSDWSQRQVTRLPRLALLQHASQPLLAEAVQGMLDALADSGFEDGRTIALRRFNAENDLATANSIARQITNGDYQLVLTASTLSLQTVANANRDGRTRHVFGVVADPFSAGVGLHRDRPQDHPKHLTGVGSFLPVAKTFELARQCYPGLRRVGVAWNPAESNSAAFTASAREVCRRLGIELLEANVESSSAVSEAASSLVSRGAEALWVGGDITMMVGLESVVTAAGRGRIPVFSISPPAVKRGTLFDLGANFYEIGRETGQLAARVLHGADPARIPIVNFVPQKLAVNRLALAGLKDRWQLPSDVVARAGLVIDAQGVHETGGGPARRPQPGRVYKVGLVYIGPDPAIDLTVGGLFDGFRELGLVQGKNLHLSQTHAAGELGNIPSVLQSVDHQDVDLILTFTTPVLTAACNTVKKKPVVFTLVTDPVAAGAGTSDTDHLPFVTGVGSFPPLPEMIDMIRDIVPGVKVVGTLYNSSEANSRKVVGVARELFPKKGIRLEELTVTASGEVYQAAEALVSRGIQALWISGDNTALQAFEAIVKVALDHKLPMFNEDPDFTDRGALACVGLGAYQSGYSAGRLAARVLLGENPRNLPFEQVTNKTIVLNDKIARRLGITFPETLRKAAAASARLTTP
jgi:ABC-type uncharacterized transport system substrate-binding protein